MILEHEQDQSELFKSVTETDLLPRVRKYRGKVGNTLRVIEKKYEMGLIPSMKRYLMVLNNSFGTSIDSATCQTYLGIEGIDEVE